MAFLKKFVTRNSICAVCLQLLLLTAACSSAKIGKQSDMLNAGEPADASAERYLEKRAADVLKQMGDYLKQAKSFRVQANVTEEHVEPWGPKLQYGASVQAVLKRPGRLFAEYRGDLHHQRFWFGDGAFTLLDENHGVYSHATAPAEIDSALDYIVKHYKLSLPLADLLYSDPYAVMSENIIAGRYVGQHKVQGVPCHHLVFGNDIVDWQLWIEDGKRPLLRKVVIIYKTEDAFPSYTAVFSKWEINPRLPERFYKARIASDVEKIEFAQAARGFRAE